MALAAPYLNSVSVTNTVVCLFTVPTTGYYRDVVVENAGTAPIFVGSYTAVTAVTGYQVPAGGQLVLHGPTPTLNLFGVTSGSGSVGTVNVGYGSVISVI